MRAIERAAALWSTQGTLVGSVQVDAIPGAVASTSNGIVARKHLERRGITMDDFSLDPNDIPIFCTYPEDNDSCTFEVPHPFLQCSYCETNPCECDNDGSNEGGKWCCTLCSNHGLTDKAVEHHLSEPEHRRRMQMAERERHDAMNIIYRWNEIRENHMFKRLKREDYMSLPDNVSAEAFRHMISTKWLNRHQHRARAAELLSKYENMQRLSLLYLAVWKEECLAQMPAIVHTIASARQWMATGWKGRKAEQRNSSAMNIIASLVQPFLG
jgi:hypothetical protein